MWPPPTATRRLPWRTSWAWGWGTAERGSGMASGRRSSRWRNPGSLLRSTATPSETSGRGWPSPVGPVSCSHTACRAPLLARPRGVLPTSPFLRLGVRPHLTSPLSDSTKACEPASLCVQPRGCHDGALAGSAEGQGLGPAEAELSVQEAASPCQGPPVSGNLQMACG